ncbi:hypothetical protein FJT64_015845 [Amphibalanus amphitrite]|uniref:Uncharacterized protein n=1 Tax=Amphibalanus amphitrite TaxID=1232801 RepID=A0A6A4XG65_AMPAM|nr:hypothetical protein FJT64_015845 [Amphibalanus amphitrite]
MEESELRQKRTLARGAVRLTTHLCMMREGLLPLCAHLLPLCAHLLPLCAHLLPLCAHLLPLCAHLLPLCARLLHRLARALLSPSAAAVQPPCQATSSGQGKRLYNVNAQSSCFVQTVLVEADIRAAFHQIVLKEEDRRYVQFLWGDRHLRFQRVLFGEQRYEMGLLWKSDSRPASNLTSTELRTRRLVSKMSTDELDRYDRHISELIVNGVVEDAPLTDDPDDAFFLPHRGVVRGDKLRVVFDGSAPDATGRSLNEYLSPGENLLSRLPSVLLNFRINAVGCQADIRAAFHQIVLKEEDRRYVQFLWGDRHLRFQRVLFGVSCSPYMLLRTVCCHVRQCLVSQPELMQKVQGALYMDDLCPTFGTREEAAAGMKEVSSVFSKARMELHKTRTTDLGAAVNRIAWLKRFVHNARSPETERQSGPLSPEERREALVYWIREAQRRAFPEELRAVRNGTLLPVSSPLAKTWRNRRRVSDRLVRRWTTEYLETLRGWAASPRGRPTRLPAVGEVILLQGEGRRGTWPLARVVSLIPGPDGRCRAAFLRVRGKLTRRPISRLFSLEAAE